MSGEYIHSSYIRSGDSRIRAGNLQPAPAQKFAEAFGYEAFLYSGTGEWYAFTEESEDQIHLSQETYSKLSVYFKEDDGRDSTRFKR